MAVPPLKFQISGFVQAEIKKNPGEYLNPILDLTKSEDLWIDGKRPVFFVSDRESRLKIERTSTAVIATLTYPLIRTILMLIRILLVKRPSLHAGPVCF
jgi:hypothetical protein